VGAAVAAGAVIGAGVVIANNNQKKALEAPKGGSK